MVDNKNKCSKDVVEYYKCYAHNKKYKTTTLHGSTFIIDERYKILEKSMHFLLFASTLLLIIIIFIILQIIFFLSLFAPLVGQGAYGVVSAAIDQNSQDKKKSVAIKKIEKAFDQRIYTKRTLRELKLLRLLNHENVHNIYIL